MPSDRHRASELEQSSMVQGMAPAMTPVSLEAEDVRRRRLLLTWLSKLALTLVGLFVFILALQLLKRGAGTYGRSIISFLDVSNTTSALGFGWLLAYLFLSGSPVAAIAISFFASQTISNLQTLTMITGSRLGASFIVLFVGFIYYLRGHQRAASVSIGVLAFLTTASIYLPALALGYWMLTSGILSSWQVDTSTPITSFLDAVYGPILNQITYWQLSGWMVCLAGVGALLFAFSLLDRALPEMNAERSAFRRIGQLVYRPIAMFILGALVTSVTLSVSVSLSILVPLSTKGLIRRENVVPYIMGANITTFIDTLVAALITGGPAAFTIVLVEMISVSILSLLILLVNYRLFERFVLQIQEVILHRNYTLAIFVGVLLVIPIALLLIK